MKNKKGFTLVELLVVIAIIGLLATIAFISLNSARGKARDAKRVSDFRQIQTALELYYNDKTTPSYPLALADIVPATISAIPLPATPNDGTVCLGTPTPAQSTTFYAYAGYKAFAGKKPVGTAGVATGDVGDCTSAGMDCAGYVLTTCIGAATGGLTAGVVYGTPTGLSSIAP